MSYCYINQLFCNKSDVIIEEGSPMNCSYLIASPGLQWFDMSCNFPWRRPFVELTRSSIMRTLASHLTKHCLTRCIMGEKMEGRLNGNLLIYISVTKPQGLWNPALLVCLCPSTFNIVIYPLLLLIHKCPLIQKNTSYTKHEARK